jgi:hypothetical protein
MIRFALLLTAVGSVGFLPIGGTVDAEGAKKAADAYALTIVKGGGLPPPGSPDAELAHYRLTVAKDGSWEFRFGVFGKGKVKKGKLGADELQRWIKDIEAGGFHKLESNPKLGAADESFMDITIRARGEKTQKRISLGEKLSQAIHKKVIALTKPGK